MDRGRMAGVAQAAPFVGAVCVVALTVTGMQVLVGSGVAYQRELRR